MSGKWKLRLRLWAVTFAMFVIVFIFIAIILTLLRIRTGVFTWLGFSLVIIFIQYLIGPTIVKYSMNVRPLSENESPKIRGMVEELSAKAGIPTPEIGISEVNFPNAFAYGRTKNSGHIALTSPIINLLDDDELKAVIGHEIVHRKHSDMSITTIVSALPMICYYVAMSCLYSRRDNDNAGAMIIVGIIGFIIYFIGQLVVLSVSRIREYYADEASVEFGNKPSSLVSGLYKLSYGAANTDEKVIKDVSKNRAFFANDIDNCERDVACFKEIDFDHDGKISDEDLRKFYDSNITKGSDNFTEILSTHPDSLKRARRLAELQFEN